MGLFQDTLRDARRPLGDGWVRRETMDEPELPAEDDFAQDSTPSGMQTVFRFQKEGRVPPREASHQPAGGNRRLPAADPLSAGVEVESPKPPAKQVEATRISAAFVSREGELETGQEEHVSPSKVAAAVVNSESKAPQSAVLPEPIEAEPYRERRSETPEGSEPIVSRQSEAFLSRPPGRGAPSETFPTAAFPPRAAGQAPLGAPEPEQASRTTAGALSGRTRDVAKPPPLSAEAPAATTGFPPAADTDAGGSATPPRGDFDPMGGDAPQPAHGTLPGIRVDRPSTPGVSANPSAQLPEAAPPSLTIGRIDVVVVAEAPAQPAAAPRSDRGFLSRNYLKRL